MKRLCTILLVFLMASGVYGQTLRPRIALVHPLGGQRGTTVTVTLTGVNVGYATQLIIDSPGLTVEEFKPETPPSNAKNPEGKAVARLQIAPNASPGRYPLRLLTPLGPSEVGYFVVGEWPERAEAEPNNIRNQAQPLSLPVTIGGRSDNAEDVDVFRVTLLKGETLVFAAAAGTIGSSLEPVLTIRDVTGQERAFAAALSQPDALLTFTAPQAGDYFLFLRDLRYQGGAGHYYRLTVGKMPGVTSVFPLGGAAGTNLRLSLSGVNLPDPPERTIALPPEIPPAPLWLPEVGSRRLEVGTLPEITEKEPNDLPDNSERVTLPVTINGRLFSPSSQKLEADCFRFSTTKGQVWAMEVMAARLGSPLDAVLSVQDTKGKELATNDDARGRDAALTFTAPETGEYIARLRDLTDRSGESFGYRLHLAPAVPDFQLSFSPDCLAVAPGDRVQFTVTAARQHGFDGEITLAIDGLPAGVRMNGAPVITKGENAVTLLATADAGAAPAALPLKVTGTAFIGEKSVVRRAESRERSYVRVNDKIEETTRPVPFPWAVVTGPPDLLISAGAERLALSVDKTVELKVTVQRKAGFTAKIPLIVQGLPTGVSVSAGGEIPENKNEVTLTLKAEANAAVGETTLTLLGRSAVDDLRFTDHAALPVVLTVAK